MKQILISIVLIITLAIGSLSSCTSKLASCTGGEDPTSSTVTGEISGSESSGKTDPFGKPTDSSGEHYSEASHTGIGDKKDETSGTLSGEDHESSKPEESSSKPEESSKQESSSKPESSSNPESS